VGYAGGTRPDPTYRSLGDHTETIEVDFDPAVISFSRLLEVFWGSHDPTARSWSSQYKAAVFYHNEEQKRLALESRDKESGKRQAAIRTEVLAFTGFYLAEDYHQKYRLQQDEELLREFERIYPLMSDFIGSTAVARVNGYLGGYGRPEDLKREVDGYGLSEKAKKRILGNVSRAKGADCPL
jgi:methionine-S-sulfoxide reductase